MNEANRAASKTFVAYAFRETSPQKLGATMLSLGAQEKTLPNPWPGWFLGPSARPTLEFDLIEDLVAYTIDLTLESWGWYVPLIEAVGAELEADALASDLDEGLILLVTVRPQPEALDALRSFTVKLLEVHPGAVKDSNTGQVWTREEIAGNSTRRGRRFLGEGSSPTGGAGQI